jgi:hypothetical protein
LKFLEPFGGYQPSWAANNTGNVQRTSGLGTSLGDTGVIGDGAMTSRLNQSNGLLNKSLSSSGFGGVNPPSEDVREKERNRQQSYREELTRQVR